MEISDYENQEKCFSQGSMSKFIESISDFPIEYKDTNNRTSGKISWLGVVILTSAVICGSAIGPVSNMYGNVNPFLKAIWRAELNFIFCIPFALYLIKNTPEAIDMNFIQSIIIIVMIRLKILFLFEIQHLIL